MERYVFLGFTRCFFSTDYFLSSENIIEFSECFKLCDEFEDYCAGVEFEFEDTSKGKKNVIFFRDETAYIRRVPSKSPPPLPRIFAKTEKGGGVIWESLKFPKNFFRFAEKKGEWLERNSPDISLGLQECYMRKWATFQLLPTKL